MLLVHHLQVRLRDGGRSLIATAPLAARTPIARYLGEPQPYPGRHSLQVGVGQHIHCRDEPEAFINHSCDPNCYVEFPGVTVVTRQPIAPGCEVTLDYLASEWDLAQPFPCTCGAAACRGLIRGYRHLSPEERGRIAGIAAPFLSELVAAAGQGPHRIR